MTRERFNQLAAEVGGYTMARLDNIWENRPFNQAKQDDEEELVRMLREYKSEPLTRDAFDAIMTELEYRPSEAEVIWKVCQQIPDITVREAQEAARQALLVRDMLRSQRVATA